MASGKQGADDIKDGVKGVFGGFESARQNINSFADELLGSRHHDHTVDNTADMHSQTGTARAGSHYEDNSVHPATGPGSHFSSTGSHAPNTASHVGGQSGTSADAQKTGLGGAVEQAGSKLDESMNQTKRGGGPA